MASVQCASGKTEGFINDMKSIETSQELMLCVDKTWNDHRDKHMQMDGLTSNHKKMKQPELPKMLGDFAKQ